MTRALLRAGARVVAVEPQRLYAEQIDKRATVEVAAVGRERGEAVLRLAPGAPELATVSPGWVQTIKTRFPQFQFSERITVPVTTMDDLIERHGTPVFCKIDAEGNDAEVIGGLSWPVKALSVEYAQEAVDVPLRVINLLGDLGRYQFALSKGRSLRLSPWISAEKARHALAGLPGLACGDLYARLM